MTKTRSRALRAYVQVMSTIQPADREALQRYAAKASAPLPTEILSVPSVPQSSSVIDALDARLLDNGVQIGGDDPYAALDTPGWDRLPSGRTQPAAQTASHLAPVRPAVPRAPRDPWADSPAPETWVAAPELAPEPLLKDLTRDWVSEPALTRRSRRPLVGSAQLGSAPEPALAYAAPDAFDIDLSY
jgi:hypothetical protein